MSFFGGNPFSTQIGQRIEQATDNSQASENWALFMEICDMINESEDGPKDAMKAIRKKMNQCAGKNHTSVIYTLTILETCVKNCGKRFHLQVAHRDFLQDMVKLIGPKNDPPQALQEKVLSLIQTWSDAFAGVAELKEVGKIYQDLKNKGIEFPPTDLDTLAPIHTPARHTQETPAALPPVRPAYVPPPIQQPTAPPSYEDVTCPDPTQQQLQQHTPGVVMTGQVMLSPDQLAKLRSELDVVMQNTKVFSETLTEINPSQPDQANLELLQDLAGACKQMQHRMLDLIQQVQNEEVTEELLRINDDMNNVFMRYERFERMRAQAGQAPPTGQPTGQPTGPPPYPTQNQAPAIPDRIPPPAGTQPHSTVAPSPVANLIDLDTPSPQPVTNNPLAPTSANDVHLQLGGMNISGNMATGQLNQIPTTTSTNTDPDFDMFAQSRQSFEQNKQVDTNAMYAQQHPDQYRGGLASAVQAKTTGPNKANDIPLEVQDRENEYDEMEKWLVQDAASRNAEPQTTATSADFDQFLASRVAASDDQQQSGGTNQRGGRSMQKDDTDSSLFAL